MKWLLALTLLLIVGVAGYGVYFFNTGYQDNIILGKDYIDPPTDTSSLLPLSHNCIIKQQQAAVIEKSLKQQVETLGNYLSTAPIPIRNGQILFNQYQALEAKLWNIQATAAQCT